jgi:hypothetical protein
LTADERNTLENDQPADISELNTSALLLPASKNLDMNGVPVLDQGMHGSCVTFANTAAVDALIGKGDYVSQACSLTLGNYLQTNGYVPSGWDGSWGHLVLAQMDAYGIVNKDNQTSKSCGGLTAYPTEDPYTEGGVMTPEQAHTMSESVPFYWIARMNSYETINNRKTDRLAGAKGLLAVKKALIAGHRVTFGTIILSADGCSVGACAKNKAKFDTWALTKEVNPNEELGGHEMVIIGYNDHAVAVDQSGRKYRGLLTLRNSWGTSVGDGGNYYMTYNYFEKNVLEVQEIVAK